MLVAPIRNLKPRLIKLMLLVLTLQVLGFTEQPLLYKSQAATACSTSGVSAGGLTIKPVMDTKFYIDTARVTPAIDAAYAGFTIENTSGTTKQGYWVKYSNFIGGSLSLSDSRDQYIPLDNIDINEVVPTYVLFKASSKTTTDQKFDFSVYSSKPDVGSPTAIVSCTFTYTDVVDSLNTNANKLLDTGWNPSGSANSSPVQISNSSPTVGETVTVWVQGNTGNIGSGATLNLTPATTSTWPTRVLRLQHVSIRISFSNFSSGSISDFSENLAIPNADTLVNSSGGDYRATYVFQVIGTNTGTVSVRPMQHISSGTQYKHTNTSDSTINVNLNSTANATMTKSASSSSTLDSGYWLVPYTLTLSTTSATNITVDEIVDSPNASMIFKSGTATLIDVNNSSATAISDPGQVNSDGKLHFSGPFIMNSSRSIVVSYSMRLPNTTGEYTNLASAKIGDTTLSAGNNSVITTVTANTGTTTAAATPPELLTTAATNVNSTTATVNGTIDILSVSNALDPIYFRYSSSDPTLTTSDTSTATPSILSASGSNTIYANLTGLTPATRYYFQILGKKSATVYEASNILDFTTLGITTVSADLDQGTVGSSYSEFVLAVGGSSSYSNWQIVSGSLPTGTSLNSTTGEISGNPTTAGTFTFTVRVTDSNGATHEKLLEIVIVAASSFEVTYNPDGGVLASGQATDTATVTSGGNGLATGKKPNPNPTRSGYTFSGWSLTSGGAVISSDTVSSTKTYYAIWTINSSGGAPAYVPAPPTITSISAPEICAIGDQLLVKGTNLRGATATIDGAAVRVVSSSNNELQLALPMAMAGTRTLKVTNADGSASTAVKYTFVDTPVYVNYTYPIVYKDLEFSYTFSATDAAKYAIQGRLPAGLTINPLTGEVSGAATVDGEFTFTIVASNVCGSAYLNVSMFIDKAIPDAYTCSVAFNVSSSNNISEAKLAALRNCLDKALKLDPLSLDPVIFLSGGVPPGLTQEELINHPRYAAICELLNSMGIIAQIIVGAFDGPLDQVQLMIYWPEPLDV